MARFELEDLFGSEEERSRVRERQRAADEEAMDKVLEYTLAAEEERVMQAEIEREREEEEEQEKFAQMEADEAQALAELKEAELEEQMSIDVGEVSGPSEHDEVGRGAEA